MPVRPTFPGVYIEEIPSGIRTVTGVATSTAAFIGTFQRGLLNEAVQIFSMSDFQREFGGLSRDNQTSYAVQQFFLNGGTEAWVVRVADTVAAAPNNAFVANFTLSDGVGNIAHSFAGRRIRGASALNPGDWGNSLRVEVDYITRDPTSLFNLTVQQGCMSTGTAPPSWRPKCSGNLTWNQASPTTRSAWSIKARFYSS